MRKDVQIAMDALAPPAPPSEIDAIRYAYEFYPLELNVKDQSRLRDLYLLHEVSTPYSMCILLILSNSCCWKKTCYWSILFAILLTKEEMLTR